MTPLEKEEAKYLRHARSWTYEQIGWKLGLKPKTIGKFFKTLDEKEYVNSNL